MSGLKKAVRAVVGADAKIDVLRPEQVTAYRGKPRTYLELYQHSARYCPGLRWQVLAAIGQIESGHGRNMGPSSAGALGPMQFMPATWAYSGVDGDGDGKADIMNPYAAVPAAALYLCRAGAANGEQGLYDAIFAYNHADWYVKKVLDLAARYR
jgi:membrane-bound lytic murein transglycosylase B